MKGFRGSIVIIADNSQESRELHSILEREGYSARSYIGYHVEPIDDEIPDCIIIDNIHESDCFSLCMTLTEDVRFIDIPVIIVSTRNTSDDIVNGFEAGAVDYIVKPYPEQELLARVNNHVSMQNMKKRLEELVLERTFELTNTNRILQYTLDEQKSILRELQENETLLLTIAINTPNSYLGIIEKNYTIGFASGQEFKKNNVDSWSLLGLPLTKLYKENFDGIKKYFDRTFAGEETSFEYTMNGQVQYYRTVPLADSSGEITRVLVVAENITERKEAELRIQESLREKETLLREIHHRVKNNLQIVSSLLNIQAHNTGSRELADILRVIQGRIFSMALVHEKMYHYKNFSRINFREYLVDLVAEISRVFRDAPGGSGIEIHLDAEDESISIDKAIPCGLIMNELIINSQKHAFSNKGAGCINVQFKKDADGLFIMSVSDNGMGMPDNFNLAKSDSMGMVIIRELVNQINGTVRIINNGGTAVEVRFGRNPVIPPLERKSENNRSSRSILIVEDERIISRMLRRFVEDEGYSIIDCVSSGRDAINHAIEKKPDLVIMDILLEDEIDGIEAARRIAEEHECHIIFLTGNSDPRTISSAWDVKPYRILTKPVQRYQLLEVIHSAFEPGSIN